MASTTITLVLLLFNDFQFYFCFSDIQAYCAPDLQCLTSFPLHGSPISPVYRRDFCPANHLHTPPIQSHTTSNTTDLSASKTEDYSSVSLTDDSACSDTILTTQQAITRHEADQPGPSDRITTAPNVSPSPQIDVFSHIADESGYSDNATVTASVSPRAGLGLFEEQLSDSGIGSPLSVSSDVAQFLQDISSESSPNHSTRELSKLKQSDISVLSTERTIGCTTSTKTNVTKEDIQRNRETSARPEVSYVEMIAKCIVASPKEKVTLSEIYDYILQVYPYFETAPACWRISVRHHLSTCDGFIKVGRVPLSRGFYWAAHPKCKQDFIDGLIEKKLMRKRIGSVSTKRKRKPVEKKPAMICEQVTDSNSNECVINRVYSDCSRVSNVFSTSADDVNASRTSPIPESEINYNTVCRRLEASCNEIPLSSTPVQTQYYYQSWNPSQVTSPGTCSGQITGLYSQDKYSQFGQQAWSDYSQDCKSMLNNGYFSAWGYPSAYSESDSSVQRLASCRSNYGWQLGNSGSTQSYHGYTGNTSWYGHSSLKTKSTGYNASRYTPY